ncbi:MAG: hypothetical protein INH41_25640 [Myxococcaceae bacterium]|jgi:hypothetical protein|nr:hypothetical protein [Myxococcaceae bacterium]MCA3015784.1 hypothetical protein [Myxococcaceae bacterium]
MRWFSGLVIVCTALACSDEGARVFEQAKARHLALVEKGARPDAKGFDEVLALLAQVPETSARAAEAKRLRAAIEAGRVRVRAPLAKVHTNDAAMPEELRAQTRACAALAEGLARDGGLTPAALAALDACRQRLDRLDGQHHAAMEPPGDDLSQRLGALLDGGARPGAPP